ncbi:MAG TPA: hypothetical protein VIY56_17330 [Vicinamibacterales bacterium]
MLTDEQLNAIKSRAAAAQPAPWWTVDDPWGDGLTVISGTNDPHGGRYVCSVDEMHEEIQIETEMGERDPWADMRFVAHARQDVADLVREVERLTAERLGHVIDGEPEVRAGDNVIEKAMEVIERMRRERRALVVAIEKLTGAVDRASGDDLDESVFTALHVAKDEARAVAGGCRP